MEDDRARAGPEQGPGKLLPSCCCSDKLPKLQRLPVTHTYLHIGTHTPFTHACTKHINRTCTLTGTRTCKHAHIPCAHAISNLHVCTHMLTHICSTHAFRHSTQHHTYLTLTCSHIHVYTYHAHIPIPYIPHVHLHTRVDTHMPHTCTNTNMLSHRFLSLSREAEHWPYCCSGLGPSLSYKVLCSHLGPTWLTQVSVPM